LYRICRSTDRNEIHAKRSPLTNVRIFLLIIDGELVTIMTPMEMNFWVIEGLFLAFYVIWFKMGDLASAEGASTNEHRMEEIETHYGL